MKSGHEDIDTTMESEVKQAAEFITKLVTSNQMKPGVSSQFRQALALALYGRYKNHWFVNDPERGQAYRAVEISKGRHFYDSMLLLVAENIGISRSDLRLPYDICIWVDPGEVAVRFGDELGAFLPVWSKGNDGAMISYIDKFDFARLCERPSYRQVSYTPTNTHKTSKMSNRLYLDRVSSDANNGSFVIDDNSFNNSFIPFELNAFENGGVGDNVESPKSPAMSSGQLRIANRNR